MPKNVESSINIALGRLLCQHNPEWIQDKTLFAECTDVLLENNSLQPDLLVQPRGGQPVAIETEFKTGPQVDREARSRLGLTVKISNEPIESAISVGMPEVLRRNPDRLRSVRLDYATHHLDADASVTRWPEADWLKGTVDRLADAVELVSLSEKRLQAGAAILEDTIELVTMMLRQRVSDHALEVMAELLHQGDSEQTTKMAVSILVNAFVFHYAIEGQSKIPSITELRDNNYSASSIDVAWGDILMVNYWPVFSLARSILRSIPACLVPRTASQLNKAAELMAAARAYWLRPLRLWWKLVGGCQFGRCETKLCVQFSYWTMGGGSSFLGVNLDYSNSSSAFVRSEKVNSNQFLRILVFKSRDK